MSEMEMTTEVEDFTDELSDEALDRAEERGFTNAESCAYPGGADR